MSWKLAPALLVLLSALVPLAFAGCHHVPIVETEAQVVLPDYSLKVYPTAGPFYSADGYDTTLRFVLTSHAPFPYRHIVQEISQHVVLRTPDGMTTHRRYTLVEAFALTEQNRGENGSYRYQLHPMQRDRHYESGYASDTRVGTEVVTERSVLLYPGSVSGADFTWLGFAHLPQNRDGTVKTDVGPNFNRRYQQNHRTQGRVLADDRENARRYTIRYRWRRVSAKRVSTTFSLDLDPELRGDGRLVPNAPLPEYAKPAQ